MANYIPLVDGESPAHEAINSRLLSLDSAVPGAITTGFITLWPTGAAPTGWLLCDGSAVSRATYSALFAAMGTIYGVGDGSTTFNLPDTRGRAVAGAGTGSGLTARSLGQTMGEENHQLTIPELPAHRHSAKSGSSASATAGAAGGVSATGSDPTSSVGSDTPHNNMQPSLVLNWIVKT